MWLYILLFVFITVVILSYYLSLKPGIIKLDGAHVVITGGSSGVGLSLALELAKLGCNISIMARDKVKLENSKKQILSVRKNKTQVIEYFEADVSNYSDLEKAFSAAAAANKGRIDILIASAGVTKPQRFEDVNVKDIDWITDINYIGCVYSTKIVLPYMKAQKNGRIVYVSSILGLMGYPGYSTYSATKFALRGLAESLQYETAVDNIYFSISVPSNIDTPMYEIEQKIKPPEVKKLEESQKPISPDLVTKDIIATFQSWRFIVPTGMDPWLVSVVTGGFSPGSFQEILPQLFLMPLFRIIVLFEVKKYLTYLNDFYRKNK